MNYLDNKTIIIDLNGYNNKEGFYLGDRAIGYKKESNNNIFGYNSKNNKNIGTIFDGTKNKAKIDERNSITTDNNGVGLKDDVIAFDPNNTDTAIGNPKSVYTPWDNTNWDSSIVSNVDSQDKKLYDDIDSDNTNGFGEAVSNSIGNIFTNKIGIVKDIKNLVGTGEKHTSVPNGTVYDEKFDNQLKKIKSEKYRNIKLNAVNGGTYNSLANLLGTASGIFVGSLGKSSTSTVIDDMTSKFTGGFGIAGFLERAATGGLSSLPSLEEITELNTITMNTMYEAKPGRRVTDRNHTYNYITNNTSDGIDGTIGDNDSSNTGIQEKIMNKLNGVSSKISGAIKNYGTVSAWQNKLTGFITEKTKRKNTVPEGYTADDFSSSKTLIVSNQRDERFAQFVGQNYEKESGGNKTKYDTVRVGVDPNEWSKAKPVFSFGKEGEGSLFARSFTRAEVFSRINNDFQNFAGLYVEPYNNIDSKLDPFYIPFEFNPIITEGSVKANYATQELMGRILAVRSYVGSDSDTLTIETSYIATCVKKDDNEIIIDKDNATDLWLNGWMKSWDLADIQKVERLYRSLVMPYIEGNNFLRPPIVRIKMGSIKKLEGSEEGSVNFDTVGDLFKYPNVEDKIQITKNLDGSETREKRYIVTDVNFSKISDDWALNYVNLGALQSGLKTGSKIRYWNGRSDSNNTGYSYLGNGNSSNGFLRYSFKVTLTLAETTKNFLDQIPSYNEYVNKATKFEYEENPQKKEEPWNQEEVSFDFVKETNNIDYYNKNYNESEENIFKAMFYLNKS